MQNVRIVVNNLAHGIFTHPALINRFYDRWMSEALPLQDVELFARKYLARTVHTRTMVALSLLGTDNVEAKTEIAKNLHSEFGYGNPKRAHYAPLQDYFTNLIEPKVLLQRNVTFILILMKPLYWVFFLLRNGLPTRGLQDSKRRREIIDIYMVPSIIFMKSTNIFTFILGRSEKKS